ncbi:hypothetical protein [Pedobacter boryungensis]|uniref:DUF3606 domain-containing protein n=1 Tax=Pedobacter boryungensis TaxID=869962 RepID=A0ABX2DFU2_9SPHI|nr:hypothetical protein [Pedobacter boryungensis]NQX32969.1 hypothetical protein [Pedobacter boryungensis]
MSTNKTMVNKDAISFLRRHLGANKEDIIKAVSAVGNNLEKIELYLLQQKLVCSTKYDGLKYGIKGLR